MLVSTSVWTLPLPLYFFVPLFPPHNDWCAGCLDYKHEVRPESPKCVQLQKQHGCHACGKLLCHRNNIHCTFYGRAITPHQQEPPVRLRVGAFVYKQGARACEVDGMVLRVGAASGTGCNCLIYSLAQILDVGCPDEKAANIRQLLQREFSSGSYRVTASSYLEFAAHGVRIMQILMGLDSTDLQVPRVAAIEDASGTVGDEIGTQLPLRYLLNVQQRHFDPMFPLSMANTHSSGSSLDQQVDGANLPGKLADPTTGARANTFEIPSLLDFITVDDMGDAEVKSNVPHMSGADDPWSLLAMGCAEEASNVEDGNSESTSSEQLADDDEDDGIDVLYAKANCAAMARNGAPATEMDARLRMARNLATHLRHHPTLPPSLLNSYVPCSEAHTHAGLRWPAFSCPFKGCTFGCESESDFFLHVTGSVHIGKFQSSTQDMDMLHDFCCASTLAAYSMLSLAVSTLEEECFPKTGLSRTRRCLRRMAQLFNDDNVQSLICFCCGQIHSTSPDRSMPADDANHPSTPMIEYVPIVWLVSTELSLPGSVMNHLSYDLWKERYASQGENAIHSPGASEGPPLWQFVVQLPLVGYKVRLMGNLEDVVCSDPDCQFASGWKKRFQLLGKTFCASFCKTCKIPLCRPCKLGMQEYQGRHSIPQAITNDNMTGFCVYLLATGQVTYLEMMAANLIFTTIVTYYAEEPYGNLLMEQTSGPCTRVFCRGNVFSFHLQWKSIAEQCSEALKSGIYMQLPHSEEVLAACVAVNMTVGVRNMAHLIKDLKMQPDVVMALIQQIRARGWPQYAEQLPEQVEARFAKLYGKYRSRWKEGFVPDSLLRQEPELNSDATSSLCPSKPACPPDPCMSLDPDMFSSVRPLDVVPESSAASSAELHEHYGDLLQKMVPRKDILNIQTSSTMVNQISPQYIGVAHPFTMNVPCSGPDLQYRPTWRRWASDKHPTLPTVRVYWPKLCLYPASAVEGMRNWPALKQLNISGKMQPPQVAACRLCPAGFTSMVARRAEGQFRRHWNFMPTCWDLYRELHRHRCVSRVFIHRWEEG